MQKKIEERHKEIAHIQNTIWSIYKDFLSDHDMAAYNRKTGELTKEYYDKGNKQLLSFCQNILISWSPIINAFKEEFKSGNV